MNLLTVLAHHTPHASDHYRAAFRQFGEAGEILTSLEGGNHGAALIAAAAVVALLFFRDKKGGSGGSSSKSSSGGTSKLVPIGIIAVAAMLWMNGTLSGLM